MTGRRFVVEGRVQGVGFRRFVQRRAVALGVTGWARNRPDGRVEVEAFGTGEALAEFASELEIGPPFAYVTKVDNEQISDEREIPSAFVIVG